MSNAVVKGAVGLGVGIVASVVLFKRRSFPVWTGLGFGIGQAYAECDHNMRFGSSRN